MTMRVKPFPGYDAREFTGQILPHHIEALKSVAGGRTAHRTGDQHLANRGLLAANGYYAVMITGKGWFALRGVWAGNVVVVQPSHHLPFLHNEIGVVESVHTSQEDADLLDEYGYTVPRAKLVTKANVKFANRPGLWSFGNPEDLQGFPRLQGQINKEWNQVC
jgi:hypothetical protein